LETGEICVFVVDDDDAVRTSLQRLLRSAGWHVEAFASGRDFLERPPFEGTGCLLLDVRMPGMTGIDLHERMAQARMSLPVIFLTAHADVPTGVQAMKRGATDFLLKPADEEQLLNAVRRAVIWHSAERARRDQLHSFQDRVQSLTQREREVMEHVVRGRLNKQIAGDLGISEKTVKVHRAHVMVKMGTRSVAALVHLCDTAAVPAATASDG
jgi:FixJ family two-component response regulator